MICRRRRFTHSLSGRLILLFVGMGILFVVLVGIAMGRVFHSSFEATMRPNLVQYMNYLQADIGTPPDYGRAAALSKRLPLRIQITGPDGTWISEGAPVDLASVPAIHRLEEAGKQYIYGTRDGREYFSMRDGDYAYAFSMPGPFAATRIAIPLTVLLLVLALLYHATRRLLRPVQTIKAGVERMGGGDLDHRIQVRGCDDFNGLARSINAMADDVQQMLDSKRQLLLAISHELRSPLTRAKVATSLVDDGGQRSEIERELNDLEKLIEELLETERLATRHEVLHKERAELNTLARQVIDNLRDPRQPLFTASHDRIDADVDPVRFRLLLRNLLENALRHTPAGAAAPEVRLSAGADTVTLTVTDHGPGIPPEHLPYVTDAFYRVDPSRRRETGGYGLGLYLCRRIAEVHGGTLSVSSEPPNGTQVRVTFPL
jgi:signal transduction histidine kinase